MKTTNRPVVRIVSKYFETTGAIGTIRMIIWKPGLRECVHAKSRSTKSGKTYNKVEKMEISKRKYKVNKKKMTVYKIRTKWGRV